MSEKKAKSERRAARALELAEASVCRLCLRPDRPPISSHVLPNSFWRFVRKDGQYTAFKGSAKPVEVREQGGHAEPLMCRECDSSFSGVEDYCRTRLSKWVDFNKEAGRKNYQMPTFLEVDYFKFKLFYLLSIWRAAMATGPVFRRVSLPAAITERLRVAILTRDVGPPNFCPVALHVESWGRGMCLFYPPESKNLRQNGYPVGTHAFVWSGFGGAVSGFVAESPIPASVFQIQMLDESGRLPVFPLDSARSRFTASLHRSIVATQPES